MTFEKGLALPLPFRIPAETERVKLVATISGHGSDNNGCAEFCVTSHHFIVNGHSNDRVFSWVTASKNTRKLQSRAAVVGSFYYN